MVQGMGYRSSGDEVKSALCLRSVATFIILVKGLMTLLRSAREPPSSGACAVLGPLQSSQGLCEPYLNPQQ